MNMQRRHFELIAETIKGLKDCNGIMPSGHAEVALRFADACRRTNPQFQRDKFLRACGVEG